MTAIARDEGSGILNGPGVGGGGGGRDVSDAREYISTCLPENEQMQGCEQCLMLTTSKRARSPYVQVVRSPLQLGTSHPRSALKLRNRTQQMNDGLQKSAQRQDSRSHIS